MPFALDVITLAPSIWPALLGSASGLVGRAVEGGEIARLRVWDLRQYGHGVHQQVDDRPFGGGPGMVLQVEPLDRAIQDARQASPGAPVILLSASGSSFVQADARRLVKGPGVVLICGRYEGVDERVVRMVDQELSVGDYVMSHGDAAAWCIADSILRLLPGVLGNEASAQSESFGEDGLLDHPHYTRPAVYKGVAAPEVLLSGDHRAIEEWRREQRLLRSKKSDQT